MTRIVPPCTPSHLTGSGEDTVVFELGDAPASITNHRAHPLASDKVRAIVLPVAWNPNCGTPHKVSLFRRNPISRNRNRHVAFQESRHEIRDPHCLHHRTTPALSRFFQGAQPLSSVKFPQLAPLLLFARFAAEFGCRLEVRSLHVREDTTVMTKLFAVAASIKVSFERAIADIEMHEFGVLTRIIVVYRFDVHALKLQGGPGWLFAVWALACCT